MPPPTPANRSVCLECGAPLPPRAPEGLCPHCLLESGVHILHELDSPSLLTSLGPGTPTTRTVAVETPSIDSGRPRHFGDYELLDEIARGGMGVVFRARQVSLNRIVAVKMLKFGAFTRDEFVTRFQAEAAAAATLHHPNIVAIHDCGECAGEHFYSMQLIEGKNLAESIQGHPLEARRAAELILTVAQAVQHAHDRGILHRDLKPSNILIDQEGEPHVSDFGLARRIDGRSSMTLTGQAVGSPNYMAPEQAAGAREQVGVRSDIWSLGAMLYHLLTVRPPFAGSTVAETLRALQQDEPARPRLLNAAVPVDLETICLKCLEKEPGKRYGTAQDLAADLDRFLGGEPIHARAITRAERAWRWCRRKPALAGFVAATALLLLAMLIGSPIAVYRINQARKAEQVQLQRAEEESLKARQFAYASDMNLAHQAVQEDDFYRALQLLDRHRPSVPTGGTSSASPTKPGPRGTRPSEIDLRGWEWRYLWRQCQGEERFVLGEHTNGATVIGLLADGKTVFSAGRDECVRLWDLESRRQIGLLPHADEVIGAAASPDGRWLATATRRYGEPQPVLLWDLATQKIATTLTKEFSLRPGSITFSPDGKWLAFATIYGGVRLWDVNDVNARSEVTNLPAKPGASAGPIGVAFSPDSRTLAYNENEYGAILRWDLASRSLIGRLTGHQGIVTCLAFSPDGRTLASGSDDRTARMWNLAEGRPGLQFTNVSGGLTRVAFSPDGRTLAMSGVGGAGRIIRLVEVETGVRQAEWRGHLSDISGLAFTTNGQTLLSASEDNTLRVWDLGSSAKEKSLHEFARDSISTAWHTYGPALCLSPDGRHLLAVYTNQTFGVWDTLRLAEGERHALPFTNTTSAAVATGGRLAAFGSRRGEVMLWDVEAGHGWFFAWPGTNLVVRLVFSLDGRCLAAADDAKTLAQMAVARDTRRTVRVWDVGTRKEMRSFSSEGEFPVSLRFSAEAKALWVGSQKGQVKIWPLDAPGEARTFHGPSEWVNGLTMLPDGRTLISAGTDIRFWDVRTRRENALKVSPKAGEYHCMALSSDGRRFAAGASDGRITIWDIASHQEVATLEGHKEPVTQLAFTPDGDHLVSVSKDQLRVWHAASRSEADATAEKAAGK